MRSATARAAGSRGIGSRSGSTGAAAGQLELDEVDERGGVGLRAVERGAGDGGEQQLPEQPRHRDHPRSAPGPNRAGRGCAAGWWRWCGIRCASPAATTTAAPGGTNHVPSGTSTVIAPDAASRTWCQPDGCGGTIVPAGWVTA